MKDALLTIEDQKEALSRAYVRAVAARAGYVVADCDFDRDGVDLRIHAGGMVRPALDLQLKATVNLAAPSDGHRRFVLKRRNYDLLREDTQTPRLLIVLDLPKDESEWIPITVDQLVLRRTAYWMSLRGTAGTSNRASVTVRIPAGNILTVENLRALIQSRSGRIE